ncbi:MAG: exo-beta-N-acetylmuramidase NamZ domain-containing protein, partial [Sediminibacterium sp.]
MGIRFGIDHLIESNPSWKTSSIGFLTNDAARTFDQTPSRIALIKAGFNITQLFSPEHGIDTKGADGAKMKDGIDPLTGLPIISLYGEKYAPSEEDLKGIEILLFDIPDAGTRFYTYLWSMTYYLEAAAKFKKKIILLDRPNPLSGNLAMIEGPSLDETVSSFIGRFNIPIKHQCSLG